MVQDCCTALIWYVAQNRLRNSPPLTFLSLLREIRDKIYELALVSASTIIVWKGSWKTETRYLPRLEGEAWPGVNLDWALRWRAIDQEAISVSLRPVNVKLILCNKIVRHKVALVFYTKNIFSFLGWHNWDPVVSCLKQLAWQIDPPCMSGNRHRSAGFRMATFEWWESYGASWL